MDHLHVLTHEPVDYDLCTRCITTGYAERHNPFHEFYEIREPGRVVVHTVIDGQQQREAPARNDGPTFQSPHVHTANCDLCDSRIVGDRYVS
jgi:next-to-BRCA1 protein 1